MGTWPQHPLVRDNTTFTLYVVTSMHRRMRQRREPLLAATPADPRVAWILPESDLEKRVILRDIC
jgi:hypothetical protein